MNAADLTAASALPFVPVLTRRGELYALTPTGSVVVALLRRGVRVTVFDRSGIRRRVCAARLFAVAETIAVLRNNSL